MLSQACCPFVHTPKTMSTLPKPTSRAQEHRCTRWVCGCACWSRAWVCAVCACWSRALPSAAAAPMHGRARAQLRARAHQAHIRLMDGGNPTLCAACPCTHTWWLRGAESYGACRRSRAHASTSPPPKTAGRWHPSHGPRAYRRHPVPKEEPREPPGTRPPPLVAWHYPPSSHTIAMGWGRSSNSNSTTSEVQQYDWGGDGCDDDGAGVPASRASEQQGPSHSHAAPPHAR